MPSLELSTEGEMNASEIDSLVDEMRRLFKATLDKSRKPILGESGQVFYSGWQTLEGKNGFYLMGLNPGGDPCDPELQIETIEKSLSDWLRREPEWSEYCDVDWGRRKLDPKEENRGNSRHQKRVKSFCTNCLGEHDVRNIFAANAIFERTKKGDHLPKGTSLDLICWQVHQLLFLSVRPKFIICLGHGPGSSFERLKSKQWLKVVDSCEKAFSGPSGKKNFYIRWFEATKIQNPTPGLERLVRVIGVPHPSWFDLSADWFSEAWKTLPFLDPAPLTGKAYKEFKDARPELEQANG